MPYIKPEAREILSSGLVVPRSGGELNYLITTLLTDYLLAKGVSYQTINDCLGALSGATLEFYRRVAAPYEDLKIKENGDVY